MGPRADQFESKIPNFGKFSISALYLLAVKAVLGHGQFRPWLKSEFGMAQRTAYNFMQVAERFKSKIANFANLSVSALYALAESSAPGEAIEEAISRANKGEKITHALAKKIIEAQEAIKKAQIAEAQAKAEVLIAQQQLFDRKFYQFGKTSYNVRSDATSKVDDLIKIDIVNSDYRGTAGGNTAHRS